MTDIRVVRDFDALRIWFGDALHLHLPARDLAVQSWFDYGGASFTIEYTLHTGAVVVTEYDNAATWNTILAGLAKAFTRSKAQSDAT